MLVTQCDNCRKTGPQMATGWIIAAVLEPVSPLSALTGSSGPDAETFCSWRCLGEYAIARSLVESSSDKETGP